MQNIKVFKDHVNEEKKVKESFKEKCSPSSFSVLLGEEVKRKIAEYTIEPQSGFSSFVEKKEGRNKESVRKGNGKRGRGKGAMD